MKEIVEKFLKIKTLSDLADILECKLNTLIYYCKYKQSSKCYTSFLLKKKNGGERLIVVPNKQLKYIQKRLSDILYDIYSPKKIATGFIKELLLLSSLILMEILRNLFLRNCLIVKIIKDMFCLLLIDFKICVMNVVGN